MDQTDSGQGYTLVTRKIVLAAVAGRVGLAYFAPSAVGDYGVRMLPHLFRAGDEYRLSVHSVWTVSGRGKKVDLSAGVSARGTETKWANTEYPPSPLHLGTAAIAKPCSNLQ